MSAILNTSVDRCKQFTYDALGASDDFDKGDVILVGAALLGICLADGAGATVRAASIAAGNIPKPDRIALAFDAEDITITKTTALAIVKGDLLYWDVAEDAVNKTAANNYFCGIALEAAAADTETTVRMTFEGYSHAAMDANLVQMDTVEIGNTALKALNATPQELVAAPGADKLIIFLGATLILDYGSNVLTESADNLDIEYDDGTGSAVCATIESTGFIDDAEDAIAVVTPAVIATMTAGANVNKNLALLSNEGDFAGNAGNDTTLTVKVTYKIIDCGL